MDIDVLREQVLFMIQMETWPQLSEFHLEVMTKLTPKCTMLQKPQWGSKPLSWDSSLWLVELHFLVTMLQTKAKIQRPKGSAMYAAVQNKRRKDFLNLGFVSLCIIKYSNKSTNQMHKSLSFIACRLTLNPLTCKIWWAPNNASRWQMGFNSAFKGLNTAQHVSGILMSIIRSLSTAVATSGLPLERGTATATFQW